MSDQYLEKRKHKRYVVDGIYGNVLYSSEMNVINISLGGAAIETTKKIEVNREYPFKISFKGKTVHLRGRVVWSILSHSKKTESGEVVPVYRAGVKFTDVMTEKASELIKFIEENLVTPEGRRLRGIRCKIVFPNDIKIDYPYQYCVKDLSISGMLIETGCSLDPDTTCKMELLLDEDALNITGKVINCDRLESGNDVKFRIGIEFIEMSDNDKELIKNFLNALEKS